jgi:hypothetical protein
LDASRPGAQRILVEPVRTLYGRCYVEARRDVELPEDVPHVALDGLDAQEELARDLGVGPALRNQARDLRLPRRELVEAAVGRVPAPGAAVGVPAEFPKLVLRLTPVPKRATRTELLGGVLELVESTLGVSRPTRTRSWPT